MYFATCRPIAVDVILRSLKLQPSDIKMINGELTRPEICIMRIRMISTLSLPMTSCVSLPHIRRLQPKILFRPWYTLARGMPPSRWWRWLTRQGGQSSMSTTPSIILSGVFTLSPMMRTSWPTCRTWLKGNSLWFPPQWRGDLVSLKHVRCVIHMGRGNPASIVQMVGRCGRGGNCGLALASTEEGEKCSSRWW